MKADNHRKRAGVPVREIEECFKTMCEAGPCGMGLMGPDYRFMKANPALCRMLGLPERKLAATSLPDVTHPEDVDGNLERMSDLFKGKIPHFTAEVRLITKNRHVLWVTLSVSVVRDKRGKPRYGLALIEDMAERSRADEMTRALFQAGLHIQEPLELQERLDRLLQTARTVLQLDRVNILLADQTGRWLQTVASTGTTEPPEAIRVPIGPGGGGLALAYQTRKPVMWDGRTGMPHVMRLKPPYDRIAALRSRIFANLPLVVQGRAIGVLGADRKHSRRPLEPATLDLLHLFAAQAALAIEHARLYEAQRVAAIHLEDTVEARTRELKEANAKLQEVLRRTEEGSQTKSRFLATMSHELRTPLNAIIGFSELLQDQQFGALNEKQQRYVGHVLAGGQHLLSLINSILDLAKVEAGNLELVPEPFPLPETIRATLDTFRPQAEAKSLQVNLALEACPAVLVADPVRFRQILFNLVSNALKFTPAGGAITVSAGVPSPTSDVQRRREGSDKGLAGSQTWDIGHRTSDSEQMVEITVRDTGCGISDHDLPRLFQPFTQLDASLSRRHQGTGLGLVLTKKLVELHGGAIRVESLGDGQGCTFTVTLPLQSLAPSPRKPAPRGRSAKAFTG